MYLIAKCDELGDQYECDANREPICLTDDCSVYGFGYEVYEILPDNTFKRIKDYDKALEEGIAIYAWNEGKEEEEAPTVFEKYRNLKRKEVTMAKVKKWKNKYHFTATTKEISTEIECSGYYGETIKGKWYVIGEYRDNNYELGY